MSGRMRELSRSSSGHTAQPTVQQQVGKRTLVEQEAAPVAQHARGGPAGEAQVHAAAERGVAAPSGALPFGDLIQRAFGRHDISSIRAHGGPEAAAATRDMGADAYATGNHVVLGAEPDLHTAAHEAAHVVQQRGGVQLHGGVGRAGDAHERHADEVADQVVAGRSAEALLDGVAPGAPTHGAALGIGAVQRVVRKKRDGRKFRWYSTLDPEQTFEKRAEADAHERRLEAQHAKQAHHTDRAKRQREDEDGDAPGVGSSSALSHMEVGGHDEPGDSEVGAASSSSTMEVAESGEHESADDGAEQVGNTVPGASTSSFAHASDDTMRAMFLRHLPPRVGQDDVVRALIVDRVASEIRSAVPYLASTSERDIASCFDTARRLFELLGDPGQQGGEWKDKVPARIGIPRLTRDIRASARDAVVYRIGMNEVAHGFAIVVRNGTAELLQGFAGADGESLAENLERPGSFDIAQICKLLEELLQGGDAAFDAQKALFNEPMDIEKVPRGDKDKLARARANTSFTEADEDDQTDPASLLFYRDLNDDIFRLEKRALFPPGVLEERIAKKIATGLRAIPKRHRPAEGAVATSSEDHGGDKGKEKERP
jgi:hypothetical protein